MRRRNNGKSPKRPDLKLNLSLPPATLAGGSSSRGGGTSAAAAVAAAVGSPTSSSSPPSSCVSSCSTSPDAAAASMVLAGCPRCLMYVMLSEEDPKCPKCKNTVLHFLQDGGGKN